MIQISGVSVAAFGVVKRACTIGGFRDAAVDMKKISDGSVGAVLCAVEKS